MIDRKRKIPIFREQWKTALNIHIDLYVFVFAYIVRSCSIAYFRFIRLHFPIFLEHFCSVTKKIIWSVTWLNSETDRTSISAKWKCFGSFPQLQVTNHTKALNVFREPWHLPLSGDKCPKEISVSALLLATHSFEPQENHNQHSWEFNP